MDLVSTALEHSVAQVFLIFSGIFVLFSLSKTPKLILVSFITLFYALIVHYLTSLRKHESLGRYAVGSDHRQGVLFTVIFISHFVWWSVIVGAIILSLFNLDISLIEYERLLFALFLVGAVIFLAVSAVMVYWLWRMFDNKGKAERGYTGFYEAECFCKNCGFVGKVRVCQKLSLNDKLCLECGLCELELNKKLKSIKHVVLFKLYPHVTETQKKEAIELLNDLGKDQDGLLKWIIRESLNQKKGVVLVENSLFESKESFARFRESEKHKKVAEFMSRISDWYIGDYYV